MSPRQTTPSGAHSLMPAPGEYPASLVMISAPRRRCSSSSCALYSSMRMPFGMAGVSLAMTAAMAPDAWSALPAVADLAASTMRAVSSLLMLCGDRCRNGRGSEPGGPSLAPGPPAPDDVCWPTLLPSAGPIRVTRSGLSGGDGM
eukprot:364930-Chlamydomonas_euryale.AAC.16